MAELSLWFIKSENGAAELERCIFIRNSNAPEIMSVRGKTAGVYRDAGTFQWTPGVKALALIFLTALLRYLNNTKTDIPMLEGDKHSLASSLDYALNKQPNWLFDMFGSDDEGNSYLRQLILRSNSGRKRNGPILLSLDEELLPPQSIKIYIENILIQNPEEIQRLARTLIYGDNNPMVFSPAAIKNKSISGDPWTTEDVSPRILPVTPKDIDDIFEYEEKEYPNSHATKEKLLEWLEHDPNNFMCIKDENGKFIAYYILLFMRPNALNLFLSGDLCEDLIASSHLIPPYSEDYAKQETLHLCSFSSRSQVSIFTADLFWHLIGRVLHLALTGRLSTISAEAPNANEQVFLRRFGFKHVGLDRKQGDPLFELKFNPDILREWGQRYKLFTGTEQQDLSKLQISQILAEIGGPNKGGI